MAKRKQPKRLPERHQDIGTLEEILQGLPTMFSSPRGRDRLIPPDLGWIMTPVEPAQVGISEILREIAARTPGSGWSRSFSALADVAAKLESESRLMHEALAEADALRTQKERLRVEKAVALDKVLDLEADLAEAHQSRQKALADIRVLKGRLQEHTSEAARALRATEGDLRRTEEDHLIILTAIGNMEALHQQQALDVFERWHREQGHPGSLLMCSSSWCREVSYALTTVISETAEHSETLRQLGASVGECYLLDDRLATTDTPSHRSALAQYEKEQIDAQSEERRGHGGRTPPDR